MMYIKTPTKMYTIHFRHMRKPVLDGSDMVTMKPFATSCHLHEGHCNPKAKECEIPGFHGFSACSTKDSFQRSVGRKIALLRAMKQGDMPKDARTSVWVGYFKLSPWR
jgi:hypothetical protein